MSKGQTNKKISVEYSVVIYCKTNFWTYRYFPFFSYDGSYRTALILPFYYY